MGTESTHRRRKAGRRAREAAACGETKGVKCREGTEPRGGPGRTTTSDRNRGENQACGPCWGSHGPPGGCPAALAQLQSVTMCKAEGLGVERRRQGEESAVMKQRGEGSVLMQGGVEAFAVRAVDLIVGGRPAPRHQGVRALWQRGQASKQLFSLSPAQPRLLPGVQALWPGVCALPAPLCALAPVPIVATTLLRRGQAGAAE